MIGIANRLQFLSSFYNNKVTFAFVCLLVVSLIVDTSVIKVYYVSFNETPVGWRIILFVAISSICTVSLYLLWQFVKRRSEHIRTLNIGHFSLLHKIVLISLYLLITNILLVVFQIFLTHGYNSILLTVTTWISYSTAIIMLIVLARKFFSWFRSDTNYILMIYAISSLVLAINAGFTLIFVTINLMNVPDYIQARIAFGTPFTSLGLATIIINSGYIISTILSFMFWWISAVAILRGYRKESSNARWFVLALPMLYFLIQFQPLFLGIFSSFAPSQPILFSTIYTLVFALSKPVGSVLFGIAFWVITRKLGNDLSRNYLISSAYGLVLVFVSNQAAVLVSAPYPPFGLATTTFMGISSYLLLIGIYSSAICVAEDSKLRQTIRALAIRETKFLHSIGTAQMEYEIQKKVFKMVEEQHTVLTQDTGVEPSLNEEEIRRYVNETIKEVKKAQDTN